MFSRIKQVINYVFNKPKLEEIEKVKYILSPTEYEIFLQMDTYDKVHCLGVYRDLVEDKLIGNEILYLKLALLHDCGKEDISLFRRIKKVIFQDELLEQHPQLGYDKLKDINLEVAKLVNIHHNKDVDKKMKRFQKIDDEN
jgi:hypothetical protein